jgi:Sas10/Utp3/C1D family
MEEEVAAVRDALDAFSKKLDTLESAIRPVIAALDELRAGGGDDDIPPIVRARVDATLAYALSALFCMYLRTQGQNPSSHPVREELSRVRAAYVRIHDVTSGEKGRPRKRAHAKLHFAESELTKVLTDAERELHQAVNGVTTKQSGNGKLKKFDSSKGDEDHAAVSVDGKVESNVNGKREKQKHE